ncbi:MAG TPA: Nif11-like leader peptide family natural product precursor [Spirochaetota bacterium]
MAIQSAIDFIKSMKSNPGLRDSLYECSGHRELMTMLSSKGFCFTMVEFEDAVRSMLLKAPHENAADEIREAADVIRLVAGDNHA